MKYVMSSVSVENGGVCGMWWMHETGKIKYSIKCTLYVHKKFNVIV